MSTKPSPFDLPMYQSSPLSAVFPLLSTTRRTTRTLKQRSALIALLALSVLVALTTYVVFLSRPVLGPPITEYSRISSTNNTSSSSRLLHYLANKYPNPSPAKKPVAAPLTMTPDEELAAVVSFITSLPQNVIPHWVNPSQPIEPDAVLDFDTRGSRAKAELQSIMDNVWVDYPLVLFAKEFSHQAREVMNFLTELNVSPKPIVFEVDTRDDADVLMPLLARLTSSPSLPLLLIGGQPISASQLRTMLETPGAGSSSSVRGQELRQLIEAAGVTVGAVPPKRGRHH